MADSKDNRRIVVVGHVDHGKSTLLGRILMDSGQVAEDRFTKVDNLCRQKGTPIEPAYLLDAFEEEQEQGISIDTTRVRFKYNGKLYLLIDVPGHVEFLKNMMSGASQAIDALLIVDCLEGIREQTLTHLRILQVLGITGVTVAVNKMDKAEFHQDKFESIVNALRVKIASDCHGLEVLSIVPISALTGENVFTASSEMPWYVGQPLIPLLDGLIQERISGARSSIPENSELFRMILQDVYKFADKRYFAGLVVAGQIEPGQQILFSPSGKVSKIEAIAKSADELVSKAVAGESIALLLVDQIFVEGGEVISLSDEVPDVDTEIKAEIVWFAAEALDPGKQYLVKLGTDESLCHIVSSEPIVNGTVARVVIACHKPIAFDSNNRHNALNRLAICSDNTTLAAGVVEPGSPEVEPSNVIDANIVPETGFVTRLEREQKQGYKASVVWLTGLSGSGKSTLARGLERKLFDSDIAVVVLDGDNLRAGLCSGLGFQRADRRENCRRTAETARLFLNAGFTVIVALISPYARDRELAKQIIGAEDFHEISVFCPLEECRRRDPKGLYKKAGQQQLQAMTGFDSPYQPPANAALRLDTSVLSVDKEIELVTDLLKAKSNPIAGVAVGGGLDPLRSVGLNC